VESGFRINRIGRVKREVCTLNRLYLMMIFKNGKMEWWQVEGESIMYPVGLSYCLDLVWVRRALFQYCVVTIFNMNRYFIFIKI